MQDFRTESRTQTTQIPGGDYRDPKNTPIWAENEIPVVPTGSEASETGLTCPTHHRRLQMSLLGRIRSHYCYLLPLYLQQMAITGADS